MKKVLMVSMFCLFCWSWSTAQLVAADTIWDISHKVSLKWSKKSNLTKTYSKKYKHHDRNNNFYPTMFFYYNRLKWYYGKGVQVYFWAHYDDTTLEFMEYAQALDRDSTKSKEERHAAMNEKLLEYSERGDDEFRMLSYNYTTLPQKIFDGKYYYMDVKVNTLDSKDTYGRDSTTGENRKILHRRFYKNSWERYILIDSVVYSFGVFARDPVSLEDKERNIESLRPTFEQLVNNVIIKEEEEAWDRAEE